MDFSVQERVKNQTEILPDSYYQPDEGPTDSPQVKRFVSNKKTPLSRIKPQRISRTSNSENNLVNFESKREDDSIRDLGSDNSPISNMELNDLLNAEEENINDEVLPDFIIKVKNQIDFIKNKNHENRSKLNVVSNQKIELENFRNNINEHIKELGRIGDKDRETILAQTKEMDRLRETEKATLKKKKNLKPGQLLTIDGIT